MGEQREMTETRREEAPVDAELMSRIEIVTSQDGSSDGQTMFGGQDYIQAVIIIAICLFALVAGAFLH